MTSTENTYEIDLQKYWFVLKRRWLPAAAVFGSVIGLTALVTMLQEPIYQAGGKILLELDRSASLSNLGANAGAEENLNTLSKETSPIDTEAEVIQSVPLLQKTVSALNLQDETGAPLSPYTLLSKLQVKAILLTDILQITYESPDPTESAAVVNELMNLYLQSNIVNNRAEAVAAREFIEKQLPRTEAVVRQKEAALRTFKEKNRVVDLAAESQSAVETIGNIDNQVSQAQAQLAQANARSTELRNRVGTDSQTAVAANSLSQSPGVQNALQQYQEVQSELALLRTRYQEEHPAIADLKSREANLRSLLGERVQQVVGSQAQPPADGNLQIGETRQKLTEELVNSEVERLAIANQVSALSNQRSLYRQRANVLPRLEQVQSELIQDLDVARSTYADLLRRLQEVRITENQTVGNARVLESAMVPGGPISPRPALNLAVGGLVGLLLAIATAVILEARDTSVKSVKEARERLRYPLLGSIPRFTERVSPQRRDLGWMIPEIPVRDLPRSATSESYRMLQTSLRFLSSDRELKAIVVTSSVPREGKSTVSANLAASMAQAGRRVLLVDADMRRSSQHQIWDLPNTAGLSNVLVGQVDLRTAVREGMENLDVLTAGVLPPNPCALLDSKRMTALFETMSDQYDAVIIDTPPLIIAADALILGKLADGVLMVVRPEVANSASIASSKEVIEQSDQNVLGLVVNGVIPGNEPNRYHYAKYHAGYYATEDFSTYEEAKSLAGKNADHS